MYVNDIFSVIENTRMFMYADDLAVIATGKKVEDVKRILQADVDKIGEWCGRNKLTVNTDKTVVMWSHSSQQPLDLEDHHIELVGKRLKKVKSYNYLGVLIDTELKWKEQCNKVINLMRIRLAQLRYIRPTIDEEVALEIYNTMVLPILDYSDYIVEGGPGWVPAKLQVLHNYGLRIVLEIWDARDIHVQDLIEICNSEMLTERRKRHLQCLMFRMSKRPDCIVSAPRYLRGHDKVRLKIQQPKSDIYLKSPVFRGKGAWDELTAAQHKKPSLDSFKNSLVKEEENAPVL